MIPNTKRIFSSNFYHGSLTPDEVKSLLYGKGIGTCVIHKYNGNLRGGILTVSIVLSTQRCPICQAHYYPFSTTIEKFFAFPIYEKTQLL